MELCRKCTLNHIAFIFLLLKQVFVSFAFTVNMIAYQMLARMAKASFGPGGELEDAGMDLSDSWIAE